MRAVERVQYAPRSGATFEAPLDILIPALSKLRHCDDSLKTLVLVDSLPDIILPALAWVASSRTYVPHVAVKTLVKYCGAGFLGRCLGKQRARELLTRHGEREAVSGL